jgi:succinoglycan biosynthesis protein ExoM
VRRVVAICVPTFRRPSGLERLLRTLSVETLGRDDVIVVVVDNDPGRSAETIVRSAASKGLPVDYQVEPVRGLSFARNRLVKRAGEIGAEFLIFVDDDEWVTPGWLAHLLAVARKSSADLVAGPVIADYAAGTPAWIKDGPFFLWPRHETGAIVDRLGVGNVLIRLSVFGEDSAPFPLAFNLTGGGDLVVLLQLRSRGMHVVWADDAVVHETFSLRRASVRFIARHAVRSGMTHTQAQIYLRPGLLTRLQQFSKGVAKCGVGVASVPLACTRGRSDLMQACDRTLVGVGTLLAAMGYHHKFYGSAPY